MPKWKVVFAEEAEDDLKELASSVRKRIIEKLNWLETNFDSITPIALSNDWSGFFKLRVGDFRVIYKIGWDNLTIIVIAIGHRSKIYKDN